MKKFLLIILIFISVVISFTIKFDEPKILKEVIKKYNIFAKNRFLYLQNLIDSLKKTPLEKKLNEINLFINGAKYLSDEKLYHTQDYWATPYQFLAKNAGDCEDYAIAKYFALTAAGVNPNKLYFIYVRVRGLNVPHMVLGYFKNLNSPPLILDNLTNRILIATKRNDLTPIYMFNPSVLEKTKKNRYNKIYRKWDDLMRRIKKGII